MSNPEVVASAGAADRLAPTRAARGTPRRAADPRTLLGTSYDDMRRMETIPLKTTNVDWISLRPPRLVNRRLPDRHPPARRGRAITYGDLSMALLDSVTRQDLYRHAAYVANLVGGSPRLAFRDA
jgi:hypothetical protein